MVSDVMAGVGCDFIDPSDPSPPTAPVAAAPIAALVAVDVTDDVVGPPTPTPEPLTPLVPRLLTTEASTPGVPLAWLILARMCVLSLMS